MSHTTETETLRFHHNSDFSGDVTVQVKLTDEKIGLTIDELVEFVNLVTNHGEPEKMESEHMRFELQLKGIYSVINNKDLTVTEARDIIHAILCDRLPNRL